MRRETAGIICFRKWSSLRLREVVSRRTIKKNHVSEESLVQVARPPLRCAIATIGATQPRWSREPPAWRRSRARLRLHLLFCALFMAVRAVEDGLETAIVLRARQTPNTFRFFRDESSS